MGIGMAIAVSVLTLSFAWVQASIERYNGKISQVLKIKLRIQTIVGAMMSFLALIALFTAYYATFSALMSSIAFVHLCFLILIGIIEPISMIVRCPSLFTALRNNRCFFNFLK